MLLLIDNYDSFTYNLAQYFQILGLEVKVVFHDAVTLADIERWQPHYIVISPGPGNPDAAGISLDVIRHFAGKIPILGVCLGHQCIAQALGGNIIRATQVMHGKVSRIFHQQQALFAQLPSTLRVTRYHSLLVEWQTLPADLDVIAWTCDEENQPFEIMALAHKQWKLFGVQFHPEAILTEQGLALLKNFIHLGVEKREPVL